MSASEIAKLTYSYQPRPRRRSYELIPRSLSTLATMTLPTPPHNPRLTVATLAAIAFTFPLFCPGQGITPDDTDGVIELSPFSVDASDESGYVATSTLAGTRIKTNLKDLGSSISVITEQFLDDVSATDAQTLLSYVANTEVGGDQGNFTGATDVGFGRYIQTDARTNPQNNQRVRGLLNADLTRGYFLSDIPFDSFNTERVTVSRGPNSLLFGIGSPGGVINHGTKQAVQNANFGEISVRVDNYDSKRATFEFNKSIIENRLALRMAVLEETKKYKQHPAYEDHSRLYGALNGVIFDHNGNRTTLRANWEKGSQEGSPVEVIPPTIAYDTWFQPLSASISQYTGSTPDATVLSPSEGGTWQFQALYDNPIGTSNNENLIFTKVRPLTFRHMGIVYSQVGATSPNIGIPGMNLGGYTGLIPWNANRDTLASTGLAGTPVGMGLDPTTRVGQFPDYRTTSALGDSSYAFGFAPPTLQNRNVFDFYNQAFSNGLDRIDRNFEAYNIALEQTFLEGTAGLEVAFDKQKYSTYQDFLFSGGLGSNLVSPYDISVHNSVYLPNGQLNPNLGRALAWVRRPTQREDRSDRETFRATAFYEFDLSESNGWTKYLGRHRVTALYNDYTLNTFNSTTGDVGDSDEFNIDSAMQHLLGQNVGRRSINIIAYTSADSLIGLQSMDDVRLHPIDFVRYNVGDKLNYAWVDTTPAGSLNDGVAGDRMIHTNTVQIRRIPVSGDITQTNIEAMAFAWQSYFLDDHIVALYGYRKDDTENFGLNSASETSVSQTLSNAVYNTAFTKLSSTPSLTETGNTQTWSVVARPPEKFFDRLPFNLQAHWAQSENFNPIGLRSNALGTPIGQPSGSTQEYGFTVSSDSNKYSIKFNWYETELARINAGVSFNLANHVFGRINEHRDAELGGILFSRQLDLVPGGDGASFPIQSYDQWYTTTLATIPQALLDVINPRQVDLTGDGTWDEYQIDAISNLQATRSQLAKGFEVEFVANPTPNWRILANLSQQETSFSNTAPLMFQTNTEYVAAIEAARLDELQNDATFTKTQALYGEKLSLNVLGPILGAKAKDGQVSNEQREWRFTGVTTYKFNDGALNGFAVGGAVRWEDQAATGYEFYFDSEAGAPVPNVSRPYYDDGLFSGDAWVSYERPLLEGKVKWQVQLNVRNLVGERGNVPVATNPDGQVAVIRTPNPRTVYLTNTFRF